MIRTRRWLGAGILLLVLVSGVALAQEVSFAGTLPANTLLVLQGEPETEVVFEFESESEVVLNPENGLRAMNALGAESAPGYQLSGDSRINGRVLCFSNGRFFFTADFAGRLLLRCQTDVNGRLVLTPDDTWLWNNQGAYRFTVNMPLSVVAMAEPTEEADLVSLLTQWLVEVVPTPLPQVALEPTPTPGPTNTPTMGESLLTPGARNTASALLATGSWDGTYYHYNSGVTYEFVLEIDSVDGEHFTGLLSYSILNSTAVAAGEFVADFGDRSEQYRWNFIPEFETNPNGTFIKISKEQIQGDLTTGIYYGFVEGSVIRGFDFPPGQTQPYGEFEIVFRGVTAQQNAALNTPIPVAATAPPVAGNAAPFTCEGGGALKIAFESNRSGTPQIYIANPDGSDVQLITDSSESASRQPLWSPDGRHIAFLHRSDDFSVTVMDVVTGEVRQVTNAGTVNGWHAWSSNGQWLVFSGLDRRDIIDIYVVNVNDDPMTARKLTDGFVNLNAQWHPDGDRIVFSSRREDAPEAIFIMNADGSDVTRLAPDRTFYTDTQPQWSFDGQSLFFLSDDSANGTHEIYSMRGDGAVLPATVNLDDEIEFRMSPAGMDMAYILVDLNNSFQIVSWDLMLWPEDAPSRKVTNTQEQEGRIAWSPDGTHIAYVVSTDFKNNDAPKRIDVLDVATGHITKNVGGIGVQGIDDNPSLGCLRGDVVTVAEEGQGNDRSAEVGCDAFTRGTADVIGWVAPDAPVLGRVSQGETVRLVSKSPWGLGTQSYWQLGNGGWIGSDAIAIQKECLSLPMNFESANPIEIVPLVEASETAAPEPPEQEVTSCIVQTAFWYPSILPEPVRQRLPGETSLILVAKTDVVLDGLLFWKLDSNGWLWQGDFDLVDTCLQLPVVNERGVSD